MKKQKVNKKKLKKTEQAFFSRHLRECGFIGLIALGLFIALALLSYQSQDPSWSQARTGTAHLAKNAAGQVGAYLADGLYWLLGYFSFFFCFFLFYTAWVVLKDLRKEEGQLGKHLAFRLTGFFIGLFSACSLLSLSLPGQVLHQHYAAGGILGQRIALSIVTIFGQKGAALFLLALFFMGMTLATGFSWLNLLEQIGRLVFRFCRFLQYCAQNYLLSLLAVFIKLIFKALVALQKALFSVFSLFSLKQLLKGLTFKKRFSTESERQTISYKRKEKNWIEKDKKPALVLGSAVLNEAPKVQASLFEETLRKVEQQSQILPAKKEEKPKPPKQEGNKGKLLAGLPKLSLLEKKISSKEDKGGYSAQVLEQLSREVEQHLLDFGIQADVVAVHPGPVITRFELQLAAGIKVSKLTSLAKDLARSLSVVSVRVVEVIPGKTVVGLELPNPNRAVVTLSEVLSSTVYQQAHSPLALALGVDIAGYPMVVDLAKMPHLLVAGTTGSGKSVGINAMILSLLFKATPEQVRLILIDPKMLELSVYDGIPHLLTPVVTDMKEAASALRWCVIEMDRRYRLMAGMGVRNVLGFNTKILEAQGRGELLKDPSLKGAEAEEAPPLKTLPYVVVVIDELADMMMVVGKKVEQLIARIAQKARAAGIHLILATQRPSVDVLTGLIKSNIPTRMSFQVSSKIDSRTILDQQGAEQLLGHGDMLYLAPGTGAPFRVHGAFVDDQEVHRVADDWRARGEPEYIEEIISSSDLDNLSEENSDQSDEDDPLYDQAVEFVTQSRKASISAVQRRLKIGYNRAARMIEEMERRGIVSSLEGGLREVLVAAVED